MFTPKFPMIHVLMDDGVRSELGATPEQVQCMANAFHSEQPKDMHHWEKAKALWQEQIGCLSEVQRERLFEICVQVRGELILMHEERACQALELTEEQRAALNQMRSDFIDWRDSLHSSEGEADEPLELAEIHAIGKGLDPDSPFLWAAKRIRQVREKQEELRIRIRSMLTDIQLATWDALKGAPFDYQHPLFPGI